MSVQSLWEHHGWLRLVSSGARYFGTGVGRISHVIWQEYAVSHFEFDEETSEIM